MSATRSTNIRPLNPDNEIELQHLAALFSRCRECGALSAATELPRYWKGAAGRRFTAITAFRDGKIIAHCGLGTDKRSPGVATLMHPMVDPNFESLLPELAERYEQIICSQMERKGLTTILALRTSGSCSALEQFLRGLKFSPTAELPDAGRAIEIWARSFEKSGRSLEHVPMNLRGPLTSAYRSLGIRVVTRIPSNQGPAAISADDVSVEPFPILRSRKALLFVVPSLMMSESGANWAPPALEKAFRRWPNATVCVKLEDPGCGQMIQLLKSYGFSYQGLLPAFHGRDSLMFGKARPAIEMSVSRSVAASTGALS